MLKNKTVVQFAEALASSDPVPGGGSVAALCSSIACSLASMVARLTAGKKGYEEHDSKSREIIEKFDALSTEFLDLMQEDAAAFDRVMAAFGLPKASDEEKKHRTASIQDALKGAAEVPLRVAEKSAELFDTLEYLVKNGNKNAGSDALVGTMMARTAVLGAIFNVRINLDSIKDEAFVADMSKKAAALEKTAHEREREIVFGG